MKRRNVIKTMILGFLGMFVPKLAIAQEFETKCRKTALGKVYWVEASPEQFEEAIALVKSLSNDLYRKKLKSYSAKYGPSGHCVIEWSPDRFV